MKEPTALYPLIIEIYGKFGNFHGLIEYIFFNYGIDIADPSLSHYVDLMVDFA